MPLIALVAVVAVVANWKMNTAAKSAFTVHMTVNVTTASSDAPRRRSVSVMRTVLRRNVMKVKLPAGIISSEKNPF